MRNNLENGFVQQKTQSQLLSCGTQFKKYNKCNFNPS